MKNKGFPASGVIIDLVKSFKVLDKYTLELQTNQPQPRLATLLGVTIWGNRTLNLVPKHIFEKQADPTKFDFYPPVTSGPYVVRTWTPMATGSCGKSAPIGPRRCWHDRRGARATVHPVPLLWS